jgi:N-acyl-D-aspartate/D-glutamate deacylase
MAEQKKAATRGRPVTGKAKTPTERVKALDAALLASGGRILNRVRLSAEAVAALAALTDAHGSERAAIENSLIECAKRIK